MIPHEFFKMSAAGNDFILFDNRALQFPPDRFKPLARQACTRALSVGADGVILLEASVKTLVLSFHSLLTVETVEEERVRSLLIEVANELRLPFYEWSVTEGLRRLRGRLE